jgi:hypothetical protein
MVKGFIPAILRSPAARHFASALFVPGVLVATLCAAGCVADGNSRNHGIIYDRPVVGTRESYIGFTYGGPKNPSPEKTYTQDSLILEVLSVTADIVRISEKRCMAWDSLCRSREVILDRSTGQVRGDDLDGTIWRTINLFPAGLFTRDSTRQLVFQGYAPVGIRPAVGFVPEFRAGNKVYRDATVFVDPTGVSIDVGGHCLVLSKEGRLLESYRYHVFGTDGGWEAR